MVVEVALELVARDGPAGRRRPTSGTGSGAIALALADETPLDGREIWATDASADALDVARANLAGLGRSGAKVRLARGSWFEALPPIELGGRLDLVVSNPPYVVRRGRICRRRCGTGSRPGAVRRRRRARRCARRSSPGRRAGCGRGARGAWRSGPTRVEPAAGLAAAAGLVDVAVRPDLAGHDRVSDRERLSSQVC